MEASGGFDCECSLIVVGFVLVINFGEMLTNMNNQSIKVFFSLFFSYAMNEAYTL